MWVYFRNQRQLILYTSNLVYKTSVPLRIQYKIHYVSCTRQCEVVIHWFAKSKEMVRNIFRIMLMMS